MSMILDKLEGVPVHLNAVSKYFGDTAVIDNLNLSIKPGKITTLLGPSGCGKTTTLRILAGFYIPERGQVHIGDEQVTDLPPHKRPTRTVFQNYALFPHMTVFENVAFGMRFQEVSKQETRQRVKAALELVNLPGIEERSPGQLSGGQQQRVALARALVLQPKVLLLDEPLSNLDAKLRVQMRDEIRLLQQRIGITTIYVTHDQSEAMSISDEVAVMYNGRLQQVGPPQEIYRRPNSTFVADFIGQTNFIKTTISNIADDTLTIKLFGEDVSFQNNGYNFTTQDKVQLVVRPEAIQIQQDGTGYDGEIERSTYLGSMVEYRVKINGQTLVVIDHQPHRNPIYDIGLAVKVTFDKSSFHLLAQD